MGFLKSSTRLEFLLECNDFAIGWLHEAPSNSNNIHSPSHADSSHLYQCMLISEAVAEPLKGVLMLKLKGFMTAVQNMALQKIDEYL